MRGTTTKFIGMANSLCEGTCYSGNGLHAEQAFAQQFMGVLGPSDTAVLQRCLQHVRVRRLPADAKRHGHNGRAPDIFYTELLVGVPSASDFLQRGEGFVLQRHLLTRMAVTR